jgi:hypothetical protein
MINHTTEKMKDAIKRKWSYSRVLQLLGLEKRFGFFGDEAAAFGRIIFGR